MCINFFPYTNFFFLIIFQHVMLIIGRKQWPKITSIKNCLSEWLYIQMDIICDLVVAYIVTLTWFSLRSSLRTSSLSAHGIIHPLAIIIPLIQNVTFPSTSPPPSNSKNLGITGDFWTYPNEIIQFAKDHPCNQRNDFECHHWPCWKVHRMIHHCTC